MTASEFKAWFEVFSEAIEGLPTEAQWERIREKVATMSDPLNVPTIINPIYPIYPNPPIWIETTPNTYPLPQTWCQADGGAFLT